MNKAIEAVNAIDTDAMLAKVNHTLDMLATNDDICEVYEQVLDALSVARAKFDAENVFENTLKTQIEKRFEKAFKDANAKRLPSNDFIITIDQKTEKVYDAVPLLAALQVALPAKEFEKAVFAKNTVETDGTKINALVKSYGADSPIGKIFEKYRTEVDKGNPKIKIERKPEPNVPSSV